MILVNNIRDEDMLHHLNNLEDYIYTYEYDEKGRIISEYRNNYIMFEYEYSEELLIKKIEYFGSRESVIIYEYDANNNLVLVKQNDIMFKKIKKMLNKVLKFNFIRVYEDLR